MANIETLREYYKRTNRPIPEGLKDFDEHTGHFNIIKRTNCCATVPFQRNDYYKLTLIRDRAIMHTAYGAVPIDRPCIIFSNPENISGWESLSSGQVGYVCLFNAAYISTELRATFAAFYTLFKHDSFPMIMLTQEEYDYFMHYFDEIDQTYASNFQYKQDVIHGLLKLIILACIRIRYSQAPEEKAKKYHDRLVEQFLKLLNHQFPVESPLNAVKYKTSSDFASALYVHANHLNRTLKHELGKSTTQIIQERFLLEAKSLLKNSKWTIAEISNSLGFEYPQHFSSFFKKHLHQTPKKYRLASQDNV
jgi:AraC-type DNA-binding domain-containing proteins